MSDLKVRIESSFRDLDGLRQEWDEAVVALGGTIYMSYDWTKTWWDFYGDSKELRIFLFYAEGKLVGVVPTYIDRIGIPPMHLAIARLVGANVPPKTFNPPVDPHWAEPIFKRLLSELFQSDSCDILSFGPVSEEHEPSRMLELVAQEGDPPIGRLRLLPNGVSSVFRLPGSLEEYFAGLDKDERKKRKYELRLLKRENAVLEDVLTDPASIETEFETFVRLHALQWQGKGKLGHFGSWPKALEYNRALVQSQAKLGRARFVRIFANDHLVSSQYAFAFGNSYFWELPARVVEQKWQRFSLGVAGFFALISAAITEGKNRVEGGLAHYDYKQKLSATEYPTRVVRIVRNRWNSRIRTNLFLFLRFICLWSYYKIWYSRVLPRLPAAFRKPIWAFWLRLDF